MTTTTELTKKYLSEHPSVLDCLKKGIINYSKLSRKIAADLDIDKKTSMEAILIACRRYEQKIKDEKILEDKILQVLKKSELEIKNKIIVCIVEKAGYYSRVIALEKKIRKDTDTFYAIEGSKVFTIITSEKHLGNLKLIFGKNIIKISENLVMITIKSPKEMEDTPGVVAYIYSQFARSGINIVETMSCWVDTIFVISEDDIPTVMKFLKF
ncbi:MAG: hypothetical protein KAH91_05960 [Thermoplasmatales archaeon]|nr:hypothetical protein [Thermoplasmatales archaeon]